MDVRWERDAKLIRRIKEQNKKKQKLGAIRKGGGTKVAGGQGGVGEQPGQGQAGQTLAEVKWK